MAGPTSVRDLAECAFAYAYFLVVPFGMVLVRIALPIALLSVAFAFVAGIDLLTGVVAVVTGTVLFLAVQPGWWGLRHSRVRQWLTELGFDLAWVGFVSMTAAAFGVTLPFVATTVAAFVLVWQIAARRSPALPVSSDEERRAADEARRAAVPYHWAEQAERDPSLAAMLRTAAWLPDLPDARDRYLRVWEEYKASRRAAGLPIWSSSDVKGRVTPDETRE